jgi:hypothetical protein
MYDFSFSESQQARSTGLFLAQNGKLPTRERTNRANNYV